MAFIFLLISLFIQTGFSLVQTIPTQASDFEIDDLGNVYWLYDTHIERIGASGEIVFRTSDLNYGNIRQLDVTNPLKPFIYYQETGQLVVFDNTLSQMGNPINLFEKGWEQVEMISGSRGDAYWAWDSRNSELIRLDNRFKKISSTGNLAVLLNKRIFPEQIIERGSYLYMRDKEYGVFVFDIYGTYKTLLNIQADGDIQVFNDEIIYVRNQELIVIDKTWMTEKKYAIPVEAEARVILFNRQLCTLHEGAFKVWVWNENQK